MPFISEISASYLGIISRAFICAQYFSSNLTHTLVEQKKKTAKSLAYPKLMYLQSDRREYKDL